MPQTGSRRSRDALVDEKEAAGQSERDTSPSRLFAEAQRLSCKKSKSIQAVMALLLKFIAIEPCDPIIHYHIGVLYRHLPSPEKKCGEAESNTEEALLHFE